MGDKYFLTYGDDNKLQISKNIKNTGRCFRNLNGEVAEFDTEVDALKFLTNIHPSHILPEFLWDTHPLNETVADYEVTIVFNPVKFPQYEGGGFIKRYHQMSYFKVFHQAYYEMAALFGGDFIIVSMRRLDPWENSGGESLDFENAPC
jgi:hypothetical protein